MSQDPPTFTYPTHNGTMLTGVARSNYGTLYFPNDSSLLYSDHGACHGHFHHPDYGSFDFRQLDYVGLHFTDNFDCDIICVRPYHT